MNIRGHENRGNLSQIANAIAACCFAMTLIVTFQAWAAQQGNEKKQPPTPGPMLTQGTIDFDTPEFTLSLVQSSQTVAALKPKTAGDFDFTPEALLLARS